MMKGIYNYVVLSVLALAATGCINEELNNDRTSANSGDEVQFGLSLEDLKTKTVYGDEVNNAFPIYWVDGDKVQVFSPQCLDGRRNAEYKVILPSEGNAYYADDLTPTGEYGVQWGESATADFYSLYPSGSYTLSSDGTKAENITISNAQTINVTEDVIKSDMEDCLLYAKTENVSRGSVVNLRYNPISTVVMLTVKVAASTDAQVDEFTIQSISLTAPEGNDLAGTFSLNIEDGTFGEFSEEASETVSAEIVNTTTGGYHVLKNQESLTIPLFLAPKGYDSVKEWKVQVVANNHVYTKTLNIDKPLAAGMIHKITLPELKPETTDWDVSSWMKNIPRNVYLSEISIPGTWNSLNQDCQSTTTISEQYNLGVRAFHLDTRWRAENSPALGNSFSFTSPTITTLSVATGGSGNTYKYDSGNLVKPSFNSFAEYLQEITDNVKDDDYMIVFCTFAQNSYNGSKCPTTWYTAVSNACAENDDVYNASGISANTLVGDVLGKVIVIVNLDSSVSSNTLPTNSKCLFTYIPMQLPENYYAEEYSHQDALYNSSKSATGISMYTAHAQISTTGTSAVDCSDRGYSHPLTNRDDLVTSFWDWSKGNYGTTNYNHDKWIYLGLGGYIMTTSSSSGSGYDTIENRYGPMVYNRIDAMGNNNTPYYPVGIILMNHKHSGNYTGDNVDLGYGFEMVCKEILLLNNKYRLQYDPTKPVDYTPGTSEVQSVSANYSAAVVDSGADAISWE